MSADAEAQSGDGTVDTIYTSKVRPEWWLRTLVVSILAVVVVFAGLAALDAGGWIGVMMFVVLSAVVAALALVAWAKVEVSVTNEILAVRYPMSSRRIDIADVTDVRPGDQVDGIGYGWGARWEGKGKWAYRVGGPMATVVHRRGRLAVSVEDPVAFVEAVRLARQGVSDAS